jgi:hypothetical protein
MLYPPLPSPSPFHSMIQPQTTIPISIAEKKNKRASSPAGERSNTRASSDARRVPGAPAGRISRVVRWTDSPGQSKRGRRSTTCSASGRPCVSAASTKDARAHVVVDHANVRGPARVRKTRSKEVRRGLARTRRAPHVRRDSSPGEGTMRRASVRSWQSERMLRAKVS